MSQLFGVRGGKAAGAFRQLYTKAGGGEAGVEAVRAQIKSFTSQAMSPQELRESAAFRQGQEDRQFESVMEQFRNALGQELLPALVKVTPRLAELVEPATQLAEAFAAAAGWLLDHPAQGVGAIIAAALAKDIAMAGLGAVVTRALTAAMTGLAVPGAVSGAAGAAGAAGAGAGGAGTAGAAGMSGAAGLGTLGAGLALSAASGLEGFNRGRRQGATLGLGETGQNIAGGALGYAGLLTPAGAVGLLADVVQGRSIDPTAPTEREDLPKMARGGGIGAAAAGAFQGSGGDQQTANEMKDAANEHKTAATKLDTAAGKLADAAAQLVESANSPTAPAVIWACHGDPLSTFPLPRH